MSIAKRDRVGSSLPPERNAVLADGVFAIVMTLMVFQFSVPVIAEGAVKAELPRRLLGLLPEFYSYVLSFLILTMNWHGHHYTFQFIKRSDGTLVLVPCLYMIFHDIGKAAKRVRNVDHAES